MIWRVCLLVLLAMPAQAVVLVDEARIVSTDVFLGDDIETASGGELDEPLSFDPLDRAFDTLIQLNGLESRATASQTSTLTDTMFDTVGATTTGLDGSFGFERSGFAESESITDVTFMVETASTFTLVGMIVGTGGQGFGQVRLTGPSGTVFSRSAINETRTFDETGDLEPGEYNLLVRATAETRQGAVPRGLEDSSASYTATMTVTDTTPLSLTRWSELKETFRD